MPSSDRASALLALQQTHGNQYVQRVVTGIQAKLKVGQPGDKYEQEADRVAEQVMQMPEPQVQRQEEEEEGEGEGIIQTKPLAEQITPLVQRQVEEEEEEEEEPIMTKSMSGGTQRVKDDLHIRLNQSRDGGQPLQETDRNFMERRFGVDFSGVRVHTDSNAAQLSRDLNAQAFTYGRNIHFGAGKYNPESSQGKKLLAHELTHVVQQTGGAPISQGNESSGQTLHGGRHALTSRLNAASMPRTAESRARAAIALPSISWQAISVQPMIQRDLAIRPPRPAATGRTLSAAKMKEAIDYNKKYLSNIPNSAGVICMIRDVLGISPTPTVVDEDFVNAVLDWQAMYRLTQDGKLGPSSARRLFRELGAEKEGQGKVKSGPRYSPQVPTVTNTGVIKWTLFRSMPSSKAILPRASSRPVARYDNSSGGTPPRRPASRPFEGLEIRYRTPVFPPRIRPTGGLKTVILSENVMAIVRGHFPTQRLTINIWIPVASAIRLMDISTRDRTGLKVQQSLRANGGSWSRSLTCVGEAAQSAGRMSFGSTGKVVAPGMRIARTASGSTSRNRVQYKLYERAV